MLKSDWKIWKESVAITMTNENIISPLKKKESKEREKNSDSIKKVQQTHLWSIRGQLQGCVSMVGQEQ